MDKWPHLPLVEDQLVFQKQHFVQQPLYCHYPQRMAVSLRAVDLSSARDLELQWRSTACSEMKVQLWVAHLQNDRILNSTFIQLPRLKFQAHHNSYINSYSIHVLTSHCITVSLVLHVFLSYSISVSLDSLSLFSSSLEASHSLLASLWSLSWVRVSSSSVCFLKDEDKIFH